MDATPISGGDSAVCLKKKWFSHAEAAAYLGMKELGLANIVDLAVIHPHTRRDRVRYLGVELEKYRAVTLCPQCKDHFAITGRKSGLCTGCKNLFTPPADLPQADTPYSDD